MNNLEEIILHFKDVYRKSKKTYKTDKVSIEKIEKVDTFAPIAKNLTSVILSVCFWFYW